MAKDPQGQQGGKPRRTTPMMAQYRKIKGQYPDTILFFRLGDFYEMFDDDAVEVSRLLELTLTARETKYERVPMCGVPHHAADNYIARLLQRGRRVAICEQVEEAGAGRGIVRREVVRILTPGTVMSGQLLDEHRNNYIAAVAVVADEPSGGPGDGQRQLLGLAYADVSTGAFFISEVPLASEDQLRAEVARIAPRECLVEADLPSVWPAGWELLTKQLGSHCHQVESLPPDLSALQILGQHFPASQIDRWTERKGALAAGAQLLQYLQATQLNALDHITTCRYVSLAGEMLLDLASRRHLELTERMLDGGRQGTLLAVLDLTETAMGARLLRHWVERPLLDRRRIEARLDTVEALATDPFLRQTVKDNLAKVYDLERLAARTAHGSAGPRDLANLGRSLRQVPLLREALTTAAEAGAAPLAPLAAELDGVEEVTSLLARALVDDPPAGLGDAPVIRGGFDEELDEIRQVASQGRQWIAELEAREREATGIRSLKVGYNKVFGYYLEVTKPNLPLVPESYERRQTLANSERFITPELKAMEEKVLGADERLQAREQALFQEVRRQAAAYAARIQATARAVARLDVLAALAQAAVDYRYVRPRLTDDKGLYIKGGRHPVLEQTLAEPFVPNDLVMDGDGQRTILLTGPNMAGKSTFLRQVALLVLMAQMGSFVPADEARIGLVDRIFCRVGAADDLAAGYSTFMVEVMEAMQAIAHGTDRSLAIVDELGRGTSTFDGIAIATAYLEYLHEVVGCRTLASTHYFELTELARRLEGFRNFHFSAVLTEDGLTFLHQVQAGPADRSYGVEVARMAGMPQRLIQRAREVLAELEATAAAPAPGGAPPDGQRAHEEVAAAAEPAATSAETSSSSAAAQKLLQRLAAVNILELRPLEAMELLDELARAADGLSR